MNSEPRFSWLKIVGLLIAKSERFHDANGIVSGSYSFVLKLHGST